MWFSDVFGGLVYSWDPESGDLAEQAQVPGRPSGLGWTPEGELLVVSTADRTLHRADGTIVAEGGAVDHVIEFPGCRPTACALDDAGTRLFVCTAPSIDPAKVQAHPGGEITVVNLE